MDIAYAIAYFLYKYEQNVEIMIGDCYYNFDIDIDSETPKLKLNSFIENLPKCEKITLKITEVDDDLMNLIDNFENLTIKNVRFTESHEIKFYNFKTFIREFVKFRGEVHIDNRKLLKLISKLSNYF